MYIMYICTYIIYIKIGSMLRGAIEGVSGRITNYR